MKLEWKHCFKICVSVFLLYLCCSYWPAFFAFFKKVISAAAPLLIGCVIAYPVNILMSFYERHFFVNASGPKLVKTRRAVCMVLAFISLAAVIFIVASLIIPQLINCVMMIIDVLPGAIETFIGNLGEWHILSEDIVAYLSEIDWNSKIGEIAKVLFSGIGSVAGVVFDLVSSVISGIASAFLAIVFAVYLLLGKDKLARQTNCLMQRYLPGKITTKIKFFLAEFHKCMHHFIVGQCTEAVILGSLCTLGMLVFRLPYATMIGALTAFMALIPIVGALLSGAVGAFLILTVSPAKALFFLIFIIILQQFEGNLIYPRVVGSSIGLPGIWVLAAVTVGGGVLGIAGMMISVPLAATVYNLLRSDIKMAGIEPNA